MIIALDYDDTVTKDPYIWGTFVQLFKGRGHRVVIVTARDPNWRDGLTDIKAWSEFYRCHIDIFATNYQPKRQYMQDQGIMIDVWIDDMPESITVGVQRLGGL